MFETKKETEVESPSKHQFKSICVFNDLETEKSGEYLTAVSDLGNVFIAKKINLVYGGGI